MKTYVDCGGYTLVWRVRRLDVEIEAAPETKGAAARFLAAFREAGRRYQSPERGWRGDDYGIAARLLKQHGEETLLRSADRFWSEFSDPYRSDPDAHLMRMFATRLPDILKRY